MKRLLFVLLLAATAFGFQAQAGETPWISRGVDGSAQVHLWFFWSERCPHCIEALPVVEGIAARHPWVELHALEVTRSRDNARLYMTMAEGLGQKARSVPGFLFCGEMYTGFDSAEGFGRILEERLVACRSAAEEGAPVEAEPLAIPALGGQDLREWSLPVVTVVIAALDAFNPCAFFVLLFLLSLLVHERTRLRMLVIGGVFVLCSGLVYFALMAAWLNAFMAAGELRIVTLLAGAIAIVMALVNIKDFVGLRRGISFSIPERAKPRLYERVRGLLRAESWPLMLAATVTLAIAANSYEALCTAGFPMVYTRLLTLQALPPAAYYGYLVLYNVIYVLPMLLIVVAFAVTMGTRKLGELEGRVLKLVSGLMMLGLGGALVMAPELLNDPLVALALLAIALAGGAIGYRLAKASGK